MINHKKHSQGVSDSGNLYVYDDTLFNNLKYFSASGVEPDYVYIEPEVVNIGNNYKVIINSDETQVELVDTSSGQWQSVWVENDLNIVVHLINILDFYQRKVGD